MQDAETGAYQLVNTNQKSLDGLMPSHLQRAGWPIFRNTFTNLDVRLKFVGLMKGYVKDNYWAILREEVDLNEELDLSIKNSLFVF